MADSVGFELLGPDLGRDVGAALRVAVAGGAVFSEGHDPLSIFRRTLADSIRDVESHSRGRLFQEFLRKGPYEDSGEIPARLASQRLTDEESAAAIRFIYSHMVNCFKGAVAELLASRACVRLVGRLQNSGELPSDARLYIGDLVGVPRKQGRGLLKGADQYILTEGLGPDKVVTMAVAGVTEVKSYIASASRLRRQLHRHLVRARQGLCVDGVDYAGDRVHVGYGQERRVVCITVLPSSWKLPRTFQFKDVETGRALEVDPGSPPWPDDRVTRVGEDEWRITLKWSKEALDAAAYEMTFWYMEKVGEVTYSASVPSEWDEMSPAEAGRNAAKMMLYYAILRCRTAREKQRAIALYNSYGFGYALGMNFRNKDGEREMLWFRDLDEILHAGETKGGCTFC